jgi:RNA polymerase sigma factor (sigma-70 family)
MGHPSVWERRASAGIVCLDVSGRDNREGLGSRGTATMTEEQHRRLAQLVLRREKLTESETADLRALLPSLVSAHHPRLSNRLRKRGLTHEEAEDLVQETFWAFYQHTVEHGFPDSIEAKLMAMAHLRLLNHLRTRKRAWVTLGVPSSWLDRPASGPGVESTHGTRELAQQVLDRLSPAHQEVIVLVTLHHLSTGEAAEVLELPEGTVKSRLLAAKRALVDAYASVVPPSGQATA